VALNNQELWQRVQTRLGIMREAVGANRPERTRFWEARRSQHILSGKAFCASCGGGMTTIGKHYLACSAARKQGICSNTGSIKRTTLERIVIQGLQTNLMRPDDVKEFIAAFAAEWNRLAAEANAQSSHDAATLTTVQRKIDRIIDAITEGLLSPDMKAKLEELTTQKTTLSARAQNRQAPLPALHPNLAEIYRSKVAGLQEALISGSPSSSVLERLRDLVERVDIRPRSDGQNGVPEITITGAIASMIRLGLPELKVPNANAAQNPTASALGHDLFVSSVKVVAGVGFEPTTFRL